jgi:putative sterol carrier protein
MSVSLPAVDHHRPACDALERSTPTLVEALRRAPGAVRPAKMRWTNAEIGAHMFASVTEAEKAARGVPSLYDGSGPTTELDEQMVAQVSERDPVVLADMIAEQAASFLATVRARSGGEEIAALPGATVTTLVGLLALDQQLHGGQFAETAGSVWQGRVADMHSPLSAVLPYAFDPQAAERFRGSFTLRLRGVEPVRYAIANGELQMDHEGRTDCTLTADPQTFLRFGIGLVSQLRATLTGKIRAGGTKPWLALAVNRLFPPIPHGGVAK